jgi:hypothetical protein
LNDDCARGRGGEQRVRELPCFGGRREGHFGCGLPFFEYFFEFLELFLDLKTVRLS